MGAGGYVPISPYKIQLDGGCVYSINPGVSGKVVKLDQGISSHREIGMERERKRG